MESSLLSSAITSHQVHGVQPNRMSSIYSLDNSPNGTRSGVEKSPFYFAHGLFVTDFTSPISLICSPSPYLVNSPLKRPFATSAAPLSRHPWQSHPPLLLPRRSLSAGSRQVLLPPLDYAHPDRHNTTVPPGGRRMDIGAQGSRS